MTTSSFWVTPRSIRPPTGSGPLDYQRLAVKDLFDVKGLPTGAGNPDWLATHPVPQSSSPVIATLLNAGCHLTGKTLTDELAYSLNGANIHYGTPTNPSAPDRLPGGSSSGSAVAVARGEADIGLGTDTGGSIRVPASYCGLYGLRPSWGAISTAGMVRLAPRFDTVGWLTRDMKTLAAVADVLLPAQADVTFSGVTVLRPEGMPAGAFDRITSRLTRHVENVSVETLPLSVVKSASATFRILQGRSLWREHGDWITRTRPTFAPDIQARFDWSAELDATAEAEAEHQRLAIIRRLIRWSDGGRRLICLPSAPGAAPRLTTPAGSLADYRERLMGMTALGGLWGAPVLAQPWLEDDGCPWGVSLLAPPGHDRALLAAFEEITG
ncbi:amidase [Larsenimonas rhizosphaerae]|uniref:amidase n=1 Tax=Larsenimonas rhizosphaerae TaxID=2944682 RepID=UPI0020348609|nr:amidase [Larsenimonas rhizosphaerae]MCM2130755.1 amidase [Larsenimonas rhizosphaerae]